jgi:hypothetical protein
MRSTWIGSALAIFAAALLSSCGGGGASNGQTGGTVSLLPAAATWYGGVPNTLTIVGGIPEYALSSSEPSLLPVPSKTSGHSVQLLPANPGVIDAGLPPGSLPIRTVTITVRDANGGTGTAAIQVGQNFLVGGYNISFGTSIGNTAGCTNTTSSVCNGSDTVLHFTAVSNGNLYGAREFRYDVLSGNFIFVNPATGASGASVGATSDHSGAVDILVRASAGTGTQVGVFRVTDVATGASLVVPFTIVGPSNTATLTVEPAAIHFTGRDTLTCGFGTSNVLVFDGTPPYSALSTDPNIVVTAIDRNTNPGSFTVTVNQVGGTNCPTGSVVITDVGGSHISVPVTSVVGTAAPPPLPLSVAPSQLTLGCGQTATVSVIGGSQSSGSGGSTSSFSASGSDPLVQPGTVAGNTVPITRALHGGTATGNVVSTIIITDGSTTASVAVTNPGTCP